MFRQLMAAVGLMAILVMLLLGLQEHTYEKKLREEQDYFTHSYNTMILEKQEIIKLCAGEIEELEGTVAELNESLALLMSFRDAGFKPESINEINALLELAKRAPFGSPFRGGFKPTSDWGPRFSPIDGRAHKHMGVDLVATGSWEVVATADGEVIEFGYSETYGKYIIFETTGGYRLKYAHLSKILWLDIEAKIVKNVKVEKGTTLGYMGDTGLATGPHLHYEIEVWDSNEEVYRNLRPKEIINYIGGTND